MVGRLWRRSFGDDAALPGERGHPWRVGKYDSLFERLCRSPEEPIEMGFAEIEELVGPLPRSATAYSAWWSNESSASRHVQSRAWREAGREVESVDRELRRVRFSRAEWRRGS